LQARVTQQPSDRLGTHAHRALEQTDTIFRGQDIGVDVADDGGPVDVGIAAERQ
jgi:hypothetical protein